MTNKITKKGRNPGAVDNWLDSLGLYRKNVAYDETCLFRAVSEQLYDCQIYHERVRKECILYAEQNFKKFTNLVQNEEEWQDHLNLLQKHMVVCGNIEINIISRKYKRDIIIFDAGRQQVYQVTKRNLPDSLLLCLMDKDHYDVVYKRDHIVTAGFCQSIIYKILYESVFQIANVDEIVNTMLYDKNIITQAEIIAEKKKMLGEVNNNDVGLETLEEERAEMESNIAPFPFKVAKALDPTIYRNIEYDSWGEVRREMRLGEWYYGDDKLILGTRCLLKDFNNNETHDCYIQEILKDAQKCVVYLTKIAERRTVDYSALSPESDAKPWPLPYRFSKNLVIAPQQPPIEKPSKTIKKRNKEKRRTKSCSESSAISTVSVVPEPVENVNAYVGIPLHMHNPNENNLRQEEVSTETQTEPMIQDPILTPDLHNNGNRYQWDQAQWHTFLPPTPDPFIWPPGPSTPQSMFNFNLKPMVASAPVTPDVVPYHDPNFPYYYNYHVEPYHPYNQWVSPSADVQIAKSDPDKSPEEVLKSETIQREVGHYQITQNDMSFDSPIMSTPHDRPTLCTPLTSQNAPLDMYSPMIPIPPGTPVIYTQGPPELTEMMMPTAPILFSPPTDMQYFSPGPYVYPPTPPATWYPSGVNAHGFIFPPRP